MLLLLLLLAPHSIAVGLKLRIIVWRCEREFALEIPRKVVFAEEVVGVIGLLYSRCPKSHGPNLTFQYSSSLISNGRKERRFRNGVLSAQVALTLLFGLSYARTTGK